MSMVFGVTFIVPLSLMFILVTKSKLSVLFSFILIYTFVYIIIFTYLIIKLLFRTYKFSKITNILYTKKV